MIGPLPDFAPLAGRLLSGRGGFLLLGALAALYFPGHWLPLPLPTGAAWRIEQIKDERDEIAADLRGVRGELATERVNLEAERRARTEANERIAAAERALTEMSRELDQARREADEAQGRVVIREREVIRNADPNWTRLPVPEPVRDSWVRVWCAGDPARADHPVCGSSPADDRRSGEAP